MNVQQNISQLHEENTNSLLLDGTAHCRGAQSLAPSYSMSIVPPRQYEA